MARPRNTAPRETRRTEPSTGLEEVTPEVLLRWYSSMVLVRTLDERAMLLNRQGKAAIVASCQGHEAAQMGALWAAVRHAPSLAIFPYYRALGMAIAAGITPTEALLSILAKVGDPTSGARQFPLHGAVLTPKLKVINTSNVVAAQIPHAVGYALGCRMSGDPTVTITTFGDGATSQGDWHEGMNYAGIHKLPVVFICENNGYAISVPQRKQMAIVNVADRAAGYGMPGVVVDGTDVIAVYEVVGEAVRRAVQGGGPTFIEAKVVRLLPHTSDDDDRRYRTSEEIEDLKRRDPVKKFKEYLLEQGILTAELDEQVRKEAREQVDRATAEAEAAPFPDTGDFYEHVYASE
ncbi:MAG: thiamine pyrophosphate-dependent dehydrogenase E1 component subunit alpha [Dehalococcoidia bacterium]|nr:thiamine pyrophosphate-dependent dehydrogenase E1 component subunit alpha [Dehalococcoidia bacterium]